MSISSLEDAVRFGSTKESRRSWSHGVQGYLRAAIGGGHLYRAGKQTPLRYLETSFTVVRRTGGVCLRQSLAAVEYIRSTYGMRGVQSILSSIAEEEPGEEAVRIVTRNNYAQLEADIGKYLAKTYE